MINTGDKLLIRVFLFGEVNVYKCLIWKFQLIIQMSTSPNTPAPIRTPQIPVRHRTSIHAGRIISEASRLPEELIF